jgi:hypothetical protein
LLRLYAQFESEHEAGLLLPYRDILRLVMVSLAAELGFEPRDEALDELVILSNIDDALFAETAKAVGLMTVWVNRASLLPGTGLDPPVEATPDLEVTDLAALAKAMAL